MVLGKVQNQFYRLMSLSRVIMELKRTFNFLTLIPANDKPRPSCRHLADYPSRRPVLGLGCGTNAPRDAANPIVLRGAAIPGAGEPCGR